MKKRLVYLVSRNLVSILVALSLILVMSGVVYATVFTLNQTRTATITVSPVAGGGGSPPVPTPTAATIYSDELCTVAVTEPIAFNPVTVGSGIGSQKTVYVKVAEITPASINVTSNIDTTKASMTWTVGTPTATAIPITVTIYPVAASAVTALDFSITFTGYGGS